MRFTGAEQSSMMYNRVTVDYVIWRDKLFVWVIFHYSYWMFGPYLQFSDLERQDWPRTSTNLCKFAFVEVRLWSQPIKYLEVGGDDSYVFGIRPRHSLYMTIEVSKNYIRHATYLKECYFSCAEF